MKRATTERLQAALLLPFLTCVAALMVDMPCLLLLIAPWLPYEEIKEIKEETRSKVV